jgi:toxin ParE1/3/4
MNYEVIIKSGAELDLLEIAKWYESKGEGLGRRFLMDFETKLDVIQKNPYLYQVKYEVVRLGFLKHFPVAVHFTIEEENIFVHAVLGTRRNPKIWEDG